MDREESGACPTTTGQGSGKMQDQGHQNLKAVRGWSVVAWVDVSPRIAWLKMRYERRGIDQS
jgi:hypothetical protein